MAISRRYSSVAPADVAWFGMDFSHILPNGVAIQTATLQILTNTNPPNTQSDWQVTTPIIKRRQAWSKCTAGATPNQATDFQLVWTVIDNHNQIYHRTALVRCEATS